MLNALFLRGWSFGRNNGLTIKKPVATNTMIGSQKRNVLESAKTPLVMRNTMSVALTIPAKVEGRPEKWWWYVSESQALYLARRMAAQST